MKWLHARGIRGTMAGMSAAIMRKNDKCIKWLYSMGYELSSGMYCDAARACDVVRFDWLYSCGVRPDNNAIKSAVMYGFIAGAEWLLAHGATLSSELTVVAARWGYPQMMQWLHEHGCELLSIISTESIKNISLTRHEQSTITCIEYARDHGVIIDFQQCAAELVDLYESRWIYTEGVISVEYEIAPYRGFMRWLQDNSPEPIDTKFYPCALWE